MIYSSATSHERNDVGLNLHRGEEMELETMLDVVNNTETATVWETAPGVVDHSPPAAECHPSSWHSGLYLFSFLSFEKRRAVWDTVLQFDYHGQDLQIVRSVLLGVTAPRIGTMESPGPQHPRNASRCKEIWRIPGSFLF